MILVKRRPGDSNLKPFTEFNRRTRNANQKNRFKEIQISNKPLSKLKKKQKAVKTAEYLSKKKIADRMDRSKF